jgi:putative ABC transport system permease protein
LSLRRPCWSRWRPFWSSTWPGAIDTLMTQAKTPHFTQMHAGELDLARLTAFAEQNEYVADFQALEFLNVDGAQFLFSNGSLADSVQDNGFAVQSEKFDFLLDLDGNIITVADGEIYVPITYVQGGIANVGERCAWPGKRSPSPALCAIHKCSRCSPRPSASW